jgi:hypothetical protein
MQNLGTLVHPSMKRSPHIQIFPLHKKLKAKLFFHLTRSVRANLLLAYLLGCLQHPCETPIRFCPFVRLKHIENCSTNFHCLWYECYTTAGRSIASLNFLLIIQTWWVPKLMRWNGDALWCHYPWCSLTQWYHDFDVSNAAGCCNN